MCGIDACIRSIHTSNNDFCRVVGSLSLSLLGCCCSSCARLIFETMSCFMFIIRTTSHIIWTRETWYLQCAMHVKDTLNMFVYNRLMADNLWLYIHKINIAGRVSVKCIHTNTGWAELAGWLAGWLVAEGVHQQCTKMAGRADGSLVMPQTLNCCYFTGFSVYRTENHVLCRTGLPCIVVSLACFQIAASIFECIHFLVPSIAANRLVASFWHCNENAFNSQQFRIQQS